LIEAVMLVALGFLSASLLALSILPALGRRADRLARRRTEAAFPLSLAEIAADRDHLRAELALRERALEQRAESGFAARAGAMSELGRRDMTIAGLERELAERRQRIETLESELARTAQDLAQTREALARETSTHQTTQAGLAARVADLAAVEQRLAETRQALSGSGADLAARTHELAELRDRLGRLETTLAEREQAIATLQAANDGQHVALVEAGTQRLTLETKRDELTARLAAAETALTEARKQLAAVTVDRDSERLRADAVSTRVTEIEAALRAADANAAKLGGEIARQEAAVKQGTIELDEALARVKALEGEIEAAAAAHARLKQQNEAEAAAHREALRARDESVEELHAELVTLRGARDQARSDRAGLKRELAALRRQGIGKPGGDAALRQEIVKLADALLASAESREAAE
jgi:chromosome segregation ATPase